MSYKDYINICEEVIKEMLFHVTHTHTWESCPAHDPELIKHTFGKMLTSAAKTGVNVIGRYVDAPAHTVYFILEADKAEQIADFFEPALKIGHAEIRPVEDGLSAVKRRMSEK
jgi:hypothetical protein